MVQGVSGLVVGVGSLLLELTPPVAVGCPGVAPCGLEALLSSPLLPSIEVPFAGRIPLPIALEPQADDVPCAGCIFPGPPQDVEPVAPGIVEPPFAQLAFPCPESDPEPSLP